MWSKAFFLECFDRFGTFYKIVWDSWKLQNKRWSRRSGRILTSWLTSTFLLTFTLKRQSRKCFLVLCSSSLTLCDCLHFILTVLYRLCLCECDQGGAASSAPADGGGGAEEWSFICRPDLLNGMPAAPTVCVCGCGETVLLISSLWG